EIQAERWLSAGRRIEGLYGVTIACTADLRAPWIGAEVPGDRAAEIRALFDGGTRPVAIDRPPAELEASKRILESDGRGRAVECASGPTFVFPDDASFGFRSDVRIERSDASSGAALRSGNPGNWDPVEWDELLDGRLGPWAIALEDGLVISICHTPNAL